MELSINQTQSHYVEAGHVDDIPKGEGRCLRIDRLLIAVFHLEDGSIRATDHLCPHKQGPLTDGLLGDDSVICPMHGLRIDLHTGESAGEEKNVRTYPVRVEQGVIFIECANGRVST